MTICNTCFTSSQFPNADIDESGQCQWCRSAAQNKQSSQENGIKYDELMAVAERIKQEHTGKYDCIIGVSGGLDSSYMAYIVGKIMGLNALLVHYDHGFFYGHARENLEALARDLNLELRVYKSSRGWDKRFVGAVVKAFSSTKSYWGVCTFCHYILPASIVKTGVAEGIKFYISHSNKYELSLRVPRQAKVGALVRGISGAGLLNLPKMLFYLLASQYYLYRMKLEFYTPPIKNILRGAPKKPFQTINLTNYVPWDTKQMITDLARDTDWRLPEHPSLGMRFDCMIEDSLVNTSYLEATTSTVHGIIASNLIHDGAMSKEELTPVVEYYEKVINDRSDELRKGLLP